MMLLLACKTRQEHRKGWKFSKSWISREEDNTWFSCLLSSGQITNSTLPSCGLIGLLSWITMGWGWGGFNYSMSSHLGLLKCIFLSLCFTQLVFSPCLGKYLIDYHLWGIPSLFLLLFPNHLPLSSCPGWGGTEFSASFPHKTWEMDSFQVFIVVM